jgi:hypothetical protein
MRRYFQILGGGNAGSGVRTGAGAALWIRLRLADSGVDISLIAHFYASKLACAEYNSM